MSLVLYETEGSTGIVTINRPEVMNALNSQVLEELDKVLSMDYYLPNDKILQLLPQFLQ